MASEAALWGRLRPHLLRAGDATKHHDATAGIPDVSYTVHGRSGWAELKQLDRWPVRPDTVVKMDWTLEQRTWARRRGEAGADVWLIAQVDRDIFGWWWEAALSCVEVENGRTCRTSAQFVLQTPFDVTRVASILADVGRRLNKRST